MELICGACRGRLLAETPGSTVACPHCGTLLQTPGEASPISSAAYFPGPDDGPVAGPNPDVDTVRLNPWELPASQSPRAPQAEAFRGHGAETAPQAPAVTSAAAFVDLDVAPSQMGPVIEVSDTGSVVVTSEATRPPSSAAAGQHPESAIPSLTLGLEDAGKAAAAEPRGAVPLAEASPVTATVGSSSGPDVAASSFPSSDAPDLGPARIGADVARSGAAEAAELTNSGGVSPLLFKLVLSYASAMTIACAYLVWTRPSTLDLPDLAPPKSKGKSTTLMRYLRPEFELPPSNVLRLTESRQFGAVRVTPLRVTRGLVEFTYYKTEDAAETRDPDGPVLKLHLRFDNVSPDEEFAPLDDRLVFTKASERDEVGVFKANNFVCNVGDRSQRAKHVFAYDMYADGSWLIKGQNLNRELGPGQSVETFIATTKEQIETLAGELVWRVHFRKGYNRESYRGVTTVIEVRFSSADIIDEERLQDGPPTSEA